MNPFVVHLTNGNALFAGIALAVLAALVRVWLRGRVVASVVTIVMLTGMALVGASAAPLAMWAYVVWFAAAVAVLVVGRIADGRADARRGRVIAALVLAGVSFGMMLMEIPWHVMPQMNVAKGQTVYVLGDSISAGMGGGRKLWPEVLADRSGLTVKNLAEPGATVASGAKQAKRIPETNAVVIVELGGNDLLGDTDSETFRADLDALLAQLHRDRHVVVMFELPLPPLGNAFGRAQRDLARKHGVRLIPKHVLAGVLGSEGATVDGIHLTQSGHDALAERVSILLK